MIESQYDIFRVNKELTQDYLRIKSENEIDDSDTYLVNSYPLLFV